MKKFLLLSSILLIITNSITAQLGVRAYHYRPTGSYGAIFKPTFSAEAGFIKPFEDRYVRPVAMLTILNMTPRMAEFPITGEIDGNGLTVYPGTQSFQRFIMLQGHLGIDAAFLKKEKLNIFVGTSLIVGWAFVHYSIKIPGMREEEGYVSGQELGLQFRLGAEYQLTEEIGLFMTANRNYFLMISEDVGGNYWANDYGLGVTYQF